MKTAVLSDNRLYWKEDNGGLAGVTTIGSIDAGKLCDLGITHNLHCIWIVPGSAISQEVTHDALATQGYDMRLKTNEQGNPVFGNVKRVNGTWNEKRLINFGFPEYDVRWMTDGEDWALADIENPRELLEVLTSTEAALTPRRVVKGRIESDPFHLAWSPGYSGMDTLKKTLKLYDHEAWMKPVDLSMLPNVSEPGGLLWKRGLTIDERSKKYIHFFDRNAQFPAAATGAECGEGTPEYVENDMVGLIWDGKLPGVWHVTVKYPQYEILSGSMQPTRYDLLPALAEDGATLWAYTPTVQGMLHMGYEVTIHEAWVWRTHHRTLQDWAKHMWEARQELRRKYGKNSPQEHLAKMLVNRGMGWLDLGVVRKEKRESEPYNRPDMYNTVRSLARYRMVLKLVELAKKGFYPIVIVADNIAYGSDDPNPETAIPELMRRKTELGGFKSDGTYLLSEVLPFLETLDPNQVRQEVKKLAKVGV